MMIYAGSINRDHVHNADRDTAPYIGIEGIAVSEGEGVHTRCFRSTGMCGNATGGHHLWAREYWVATSGNVTDEVWKEYIKNQTPPEHDDDFHVL